MPGARLLARLTLAVFFAAWALIPAYAVTYEMVTVGDPGNANDTTGYGAVNYEYQIGKYEVTIGQYVAFLNAVAKTDTYSLYSSPMRTERNSAGIQRSGTTGSYFYSAIGPFGPVQIPQSTTSSRPVTYVSWFNAARFANWMSNGQPSGAQGPTTTEDGAYRLNGSTSGTAPASNLINPNTGLMPAYRLPTENEWYKAAYYRAGGNNAGYWAFATQSSVPPANIPGDGTNNANYRVNGLVFSVTQSDTESSSQNYTVDVGTFRNSPSAYGTFDQSGNVLEWNDLTGAAGTNRGIRGGNLFGDSLAISSASRLSVAPGDFGNGFRLVAVPEPSTYAMTIAGLACGGWHLRRRRRAWRSRRCRCGNSGLQRGGERSSIEVTAEFVME